MQAGARLKKKVDIALSSVRELNISKIKAYNEFNKRS
jgi:hypothetical protein